MDSRNAELRPGYQRVENTKALGIKTLLLSSVDKKIRFPNDIYYVNIPNLSPDEVIIPDTMNLVLNLLTATPSLGLKTT